MKQLLIRLALVIVAATLPTGPAFAKAHLAPGQTLRDCAGCGELVVLPAGTFVMGSPDSEPGRDPAEGPPHRVAIRSFALARYDVTIAEWRRFVIATKRPVASWNDAQAYVAWLSKRTGKHYRLPTEAEWEYAARAGTTTVYPWGVKVSHDRANYGADECCSERASGADKWLHTSPVGSFPPNAFGLYDMQGNAWQWVQDCYADPPDLIRSAYRNWAPPPRWPNSWEYRSGGVGFRVARSIE
jgi:formylglycine-generating enzyme required for sulfatase activity